MTSSTPQPLALLARASGTATPEHHEAAKGALEGVAPPPERLADEAFWDALHELLQGLGQVEQSYGTQYKLRDLCKVLGGEEMLGWVLVGYIRAACASNRKNANRLGKPWLSSDEPDLRAPLRYWLRQPKHTSQRALVEILARQCDRADLPLLLSLMGPDARVGSKASWTATQAVREMGPAAIDPLIEAAKVSTRPRAFLSVVASIEYTHPTEILHAAHRLRAELPPSVHDEPLCGLIRAQASALTLRDCLGFLLTREPGHNLSGAWLGDVLMAHHGDEARAEALKLLSHPHPAMVAGAVRYFLYHPDAEAIGGLEALLERGEPLGEPCRAELVRGVLGGCRALLPA